MLLCPLGGARKLVNALGVVMALQSSYLLYLCFTDFLGIYTFFFPYLLSIQNVLILVSISALACVVILFTIPPP